MTGYAKLDALEAVRSALRQIVERSLEAPASHRQCVHRVADSVGKLLRRALALSAERARYGQIGVVRGAFLFLQRFYAEPAAQLLEALGRLREQLRQSLGRNPILARGRMHGFESLLDIAQPRRIEIEPLAIVTQAVGRLLNLDLGRLQDV